MAISLQRLLLVFSLMLIVATGQLYSQPKEADLENFSMVEVEVTKDQVKTLVELGLPIDCSYKAITKDGYRISLPLTQYDIEMLKKQRIAYQVVIEDVANYYAQRSLAENDAKCEAIKKSSGVQMDYGTMGGFYKLSELYSTVDKLHSKYNGKKLITQKFSIGKSHEGRDIYVIKISDNADREEGEREPQVLYTALTHAREPAGMMTVVYFMHYILENYETDQRVKNIVDNCELYFIPCSNPDGYTYNQTKNPNGGGMWRKNRNGSGVDLNRNFGPHDLWDYPNNGSSTSPWSQTYRGTSEFSEAETRVIRDFVATKNFRVALNYHTYSNLLIYPWGYISQIADPFFKTMAVDMTKINGYRYGTAQQLLYAVRGDSDSWYFKVHKVFAMTPEVGGYGDGFWPSKSRIFPLAQENLESNLLLSEFALQLRPAKK